MCATLLPVHFPCQHHAMKAKAMTKGALTEALATQHEDSLVKIASTKVKKKGIFNTSGLCCQDPRKASQEDRCLHDDQSGKESKDKASTDRCESVPSGCPALCATLLLVHPPCQHHAMKAKAMTKDALTKALAT